MTSNFASKRKNTDKTARHTASEKFPAKKRKLSSSSTLVKIAEPVVLDLTDEPKAKVAKRSRQKFKFSEDFVVTISSSDNDDDDADDASKSAKKSSQTTAAATAPRSQKSGATGSSGGGARIGDKAPPRSGGVTWQQRPVKVAHAHKSAASTANISRQVASASSRVTPSTAAPMSRLEAGSGAQAKKVAAAAAAAAAASGKGSKPVKNRVPDSSTRTVSAKLPTTAATTSKQQRRLDQSNSSDDVIVMSVSRSSSSTPRPTPAAASATATTAAAAADDVHYECDFCKTKHNVKTILTTEKSMLRHLQWEHFDYRPYRCTLCKYRDLDERSIRSHFRREHKGISTYVHVQSDLRS